MNTRKQELIGGCLEGQLPQMLFTFLDSDEDQGENMSLLVSQWNNKRKHIEFGSNSSSYEPHSFGKDTYLVPFLICKMGIMTFPYRAAMRISLDNRCERLNSVRGRRFKTC